jgi:hypothetical protein
MGGSGLHRESISTQEEKNISRAVLISTVENEQARRREQMFVSKMNAIGKTWERPFELIPVPEEGNCMYQAILATMNS